MNVSEFKYEFNIGWNNIMSNQAPGLSDYEISVFLTQAQEFIVKGIYNGTLTNSFESTEESRSYLSTLVEQGYPTKIVDQNKYSHITKGSILYDMGDIKDSKGNKLATKPWFTIYEGVIFGHTSRCADGDEGIVKPVTHDTFWEIKRNPFKRDNERRVLRLTYTNTLTDKDSVNTTNIAELVTDYNIDKYFIRYIRKPRPIIITDLTNLTIDGYRSNIDAGFTENECCELNESLHRMIIETAIKLAQQVWVMTKTQPKE